jgi:hypothetical protein
MQLQTLRQTRTLVLGVLAWFVLSLGVAIASPVVKPQALSLVCSGIGAVKLVAPSEDGTVPAASAHTLDCALCFAAGAPPTASATMPIAVGPLPLVVATLQHSPPVLHSAAPPPARGPPDLT